jgi:hypothetical protein
LEIEEEPPADAAPPPAPTTAEIAVDEPLAKVNDADE